jgi:OOP family OmpA-OmpF porin
MIKVKTSVIWMVAVPIMVLGTAGCATKKFVRNQVNPVNQRVGKLETQTNEQIAALNSKEEGDISRVNERISTTDQKVAQVASAAQQAQGTASRALEATEMNQTKTAANSAAITTLASGVANALNYQLVEKGDVTFGFNKATLTPAAKVTLDELAQKAQAQPRTVVELVGFTDKVGSANYNFALSRRRAEAVQRYLVKQKVPLYAIHIIGLGKDTPPEVLAAENEAVDSNASPAEINRLARRVHVRVFGASEITRGSASRDQ